MYDLHKGARGAQEGTRLSVGDHRQADDGAQEPEAQQAAPRGARAAVEHAKHGEALLGAADAHGRGVLLLLHARLSLKPQISLCNLTMLQTSWQSMK